MMPLTLAADPFKHFAPVGLLLLMAIGFGAFTLVATHLLGTGRKGPIKGSVYESGMNPIGNARRRFNVRFYIVAMTFLVFDVEIVFLYPWAVSFASLGGTQGPLRRHAHGIIINADCNQFTPTPPVGR
jgi:NADH-quinone oxidoreductase subunit A